VVRARNCDESKRNLAMNNLMTSAGPILAAEPVLRLGVFLVVLALLAALEWRAPRRRGEAQRKRRWPGNLGMMMLDTLLVRILFPTAAVGVALAAEADGVGLLNQLALPSWLAVLLAIVALDLIIYAQHVLFHAAPWLWRLHRVHHSDVAVDVTTGLRFHPVEILLSMLIKLGAVIALGAPALAVMLFEIILNATSMFSHSNIRLPAALDRVVRALLVTPDMHRVHHSIVARETGSNFGFNLAIWDRLFGTYRARPAAGHEAMTLGLPAFRGAGESRLDRMLWQPLRRD
jgi:sterol desaturase/sphingolipid hydroxylase (fatty acid hydroxylase superfamily)